VRTPAFDVPPGYLRWAGAGTGVVLLGVLIAVLVSVFGLFGTSTEDQGSTVLARVVTGVACVEADATETVAFTAGGRRHRVRFDGCGHARDEPVAVTVPAGSVDGNVVVHSADAAVGDSRDGEGLGLLLIVVSGIAGAGYAFLVRRGPRATPLPPALRLTQATSAGGDNHVLHW
jgi:hypothetical protein